MEPFDPRQIVGRTVRSVAVATGDEAIGLSFDDGSTMWVHPSGRHCEEIALSFSYKAPPRNPYDREGKWYWSDETEMEYGPLDTKEAAEAQLKDYCEKYL